MNRFTKCKARSYIFILSLILSISLVSCSKQTEEIIYTPGKHIADTKSLSADELTIFTSSNMAFDTPSDLITGALEERFLRGDALYDQPRVANPTEFEGAGGLGPLYVGFSCGSCHSNAGRNKSTLLTHGGTGNGFSSQLVFIKSKNGQYFPEYGRVLHDQATYGVTPEGRINVEYTEQHYTFPDGEPYSLTTPKYWISDWYATEIPDEELVMSVRTPCSHVGLGLGMAVDQNELLALAAKEYPEYNISGEINYVYERNQKLIGTGGLKAQHADLTVELGFSSDMGVTNHRFPDEVGKDQSQTTEDFGIEISTVDMADVEFYLMSLGVPARRNVNDPQVLRGEENFRKAKCNLCHVETLHTSSEPIKLMDGTRMTHLAGRTIHPYTDYLIHDMGPELGDDYDQYNASGDEWRTAPLWGLGLLETVSGHTGLLHDQRARNITEAIMWHGGEGAYSREVFRNMSKEDRDAMIAFLESL
ncbi:thiol oxidoreductase [Ancylomarina sp. DW003]|nr:di-heme oxidoredictase family protein [Ancylomarina sp. DW003]MDE5421988.1 thiol oxidoreductase [Ancylomarina sp. DW003]